MSRRALRWLLALAHRRRAAGPRLVVVRHHRVYGPSERPLYRLGVSASVLEAQLALLARRGLAPVTVREGLARIAERRPGVVVAMTFDDGYADNVERALPLLRAHGARATFYLTAGLMEDRVAPWWDALEHVLGRTRAPRLDVGVNGERVTAPLGTRAERVAALHRLLPAMRVAPETRRARLGALAETLDVRDAPSCALADWSLAARLAEAGMEIGAHTLTHPHLTLLDEAEQEREIAGSCALIERRLGLRPEGLAYPGGDYDARTLAIVERLGLAHAVTTRAGDNRPEAPRHELRRRGLSEGACLGPGGRFSSRLALAELDGAFDALRGAESAS